jgi:ABC-2 type transport system permease protein
MLGLTGAYQLILWALGASMPGVVLTGYVGLLLSGGAYIAVGLFVSSTTENQIVAAVVAFGLLLLFWVIGWAANLVGPFLGSIFQHVSLTRHMEQFSKGVLDWGSLVYLLCFIAFFLFLSLRSLESKRWRA